MSVSGHRPSSRLFVALAAAFATLVALFAVVAPAQAAVPAAPTGLAPNGDTQTGIPVLSWDRQDDATTYDVAVSANASFSPTLWTQNGTYNDKAAPAVQLPLGTIYWRVRAHNTSGNSDWTTTTFTHQAVAPPNQIAPAEGATLQEGDDTPVFQWSPVAGATGYVVRVGQDADFTDPNRYTTLKTVQAQAVSVNGYLPPNTYYWEVQAKLGTGYNTDWSAPRTLVLQGLDQPALQGPPDDVNNGIQDVVLNWTPVAGAATYEVQVSTDQNFNTTVANVTNIKGTRYSPPTTLNNDQYYWRVRAVDASGNKPDWSLAPIWHFKRNWPDQPTLEYPQDNTTVGDPFYLQWSAVPHASEYQVQVASNSGFTGTVRSCTTASTTLTSLCLPTAGGTYYWRVQAIDQPKPVTSDVISAQVGKFTYQPDTAIQVTPADGSTVSLPTFSWQPVAGIDRYKVTYVDTDNNDTNSATTSALSYTPRDALIVGDHYRWSVQTITSDNRLGTIPLVAAQPRFTVTAPDPATAATPEPTNNPTSARFPGLTWTPVVNATSYDLYVRPSGNGAFTQVNGTFQYPAGDDIGTTLSAPGSYDWIVEAYDDGGDLIAQSATLGHYTISPIPQPDETAVGLTGNAITGNAGTSVDSCPSTLPSSCQNLRGTPVLSWTPDPSASYYNLYISFDAEMTNMFAGPIKVTGSMWSDLAEMPDSQAGSAYYWEVVPCTASNICGPLQHATRAFNKESDTVVLNSPVSADPNNPTTVQNDVRLSWQDYLDTETAADTTDTSLTTPARIGPRQYRVQVSQTAAFGVNDIVETAVVDQTTFTSYLTTYPEGPLYWRVQVVDDTGNNLNWSPTGVFTKSSPAPVQTYPMPTGGHMPVVNGTNQFTWDPENFAASYDLEVYKNDDLVGQTANRVLSANSLVTAYAPSSLLPASSTPYTWRVRRVDAAGRKGPWSALQEFLVTGDSPTLTSPVNGSHEAPNDTLFTWLPSTNAATYKLELRQAGASSVFETMTTPNTSWAEPKALTTGDWQWRVTALDANGVTLGAPGSWTDMQFTVDGSVLAIDDVLISGNTDVGSLLTLEAPNWNVPGVTTTYQWQRNGANISGQTGTGYTLVQADVGKTITVKATGTKAGYATGTSISNGIGGTEGPAPVPSQDPKVNGTPKYGQTLTADHGVWPGSPTYKYQWLRNGSAVSGATGTAYRVQAADAGQHLSVRVTATITGYAPGVATSPEVSVDKLTSMTTATLLGSTIKKSVRGKVSVSVTGSGVSHPTGTLTVKQGKKVLAKVKLKSGDSGRKTIRLPKLGKGKHKLKVVYGGSSTVKGSTSKTVTLKVTS